MYRLGQHPPYDNREHTAWLRELPEFRMRFDHRAGKADRAKGLAWREYGFEDGLGLAAVRYDERYLAGVRRAQGVLPPKMRDIARVLVISYDVALAIPASDPLRRADVPRFQAACLDRLRGKGLAAADQKFLERRLEVIDPDEPPRLEVRSASGLRVGEPAAISATGTEQGYCTARASQAGYPVVGLYEGDGYIALSPLLRAALKIDG